MTSERPELGAVVGPVEVGRVAHGGSWVARVDGFVLFVRHALEGELVRVRITAVGRRYGRADVVEVLRASPARVRPPCPVAGVCGGCDLQHVAIPSQRELKRQVVDEQLRRLAGLRFDGVVEEVPPGALGWRTRMRYSAAPGGWGLRASRTHDVVPLPAQGCLLADPALARPDVPPGPAELVGVKAASGVHWGAPEDDTILTERAAGRTWQVHAGGFWQAHAGAADTLADAVVAGLAPRPGERAFDLYCGVGLFAGALAARGVAVIGVEGDQAAVALARVNVPTARFSAGAVDRVLRGLPRAVDLVVLDPPRAGAGPAVMAQVLDRRPRAVAYVACDPAALARDLATALASGWRVASLRAFDLFGMTSHVECVAVLQPDDRLDSVESRRLDMEADPRDKT